MARVPLPAREELPDDYQYLLAEDVLGPRNIFRAFGNNPPVLQSYMRYGTTVWEDAGLSARERELVILAIARTLHSRYEWHQHVEIAQDVGISLAEISAIGREDYTDFTDTERALLVYATAFAARNVDESTHSQLAENHEPATIIGTALLASHYVATAYALDALAVPLETEFVGWTPPTDAESSADTTSP